MLLLSLVLIHRSILKFDRRTVRIAWTIVLLSGVVLSTRLVDRYQEMIFEYERFGTFRRMVLWEQAFYAFRENVVFGYGPGKESVLWVMGDAGQSTGQSTEEPVRLYKSIPTIRLSMSESKVEQLLC